MALTCPRGYGHIACYDFTNMVKALSLTGDEVPLKVTDTQENVQRRFEREIRGTVDAACPSTIRVHRYDDSYEWYSAPSASHTFAEIPTLQGD